MICTRQILATTTAQPIARLAGTRQFEIQNLGPNPIYVALDDPTTCIVGRCRAIQPGEAWSVESRGLIPYVICAVAQVDGGGTIMTEA